MLVLTCGELRQHLFPFGYGGAVTPPRSRPLPPPRPLTTRARSVTVAMIATALGQLLGCAPGPTPVPTPTPAFASEEEAFAAAEEVYRAYNDAVNARSNGSEHADPRRYLTGPALEGDIDAQNLLSSSNLHVSGAAVIEAFFGESADLDRSLPTMTGIVCMDVSNVSLIDESGADVTPLDRGEKIEQRVVFLGAGDALRISNESMADGSTC